MKPVMAAAPDTHRLDNGVPGLRPKTNPLIRPF